MSEDRFYRYVRLLTDTVRSSLLSCYHSELGDLKTELQHNILKLVELVQRFELKRHEWGILFPGVDIPTQSDVTEYLNKTPVDVWRDLGLTSVQPPDIKDLDVRLLSLLMENMLPQTSPRIAVITAVWEMRCSLTRNENKTLTPVEFNNLWTEAETAIHNLSGNTFDSDITSALNTGINISALDKRLEELKIYDKQADSVIPQSKLGLKGDERDRFMRFWLLLNRAGRGALFKCYDTHFQQATLKTVLEKHILNIPVFNTMHFKTLFPGATCPTKAMITGIQPPNVAGSLLTQLHLDTAPIPKFKDLDITAQSFLLRNLIPHENQKPHQNLIPHKDKLDLLLKMIQRIKELRNSCAHNKDLTISMDEFKNKWTEAENAINNLVGNKCDQEIESSFDEVIGEAFKEELLKLKEDVMALLDKLETRTDKLETGSGELKTRMDEHETRITEIEKKKVPTATLR